MTAVKRTRLAPETRRAQLIALGLELLATRRLDELSVELIAERAGISRGLLFHYFASKHEFHVEVARAAAAEMLRRTEPAPDLEPADALRSAIAAFITYADENPDNYVSLVRGAASGDAEMRAIFDGTRAALGRRIVEVVAGQGFVLDDRAELAVHGWVAFAEECVVRWLSTRRPDRPALEAMIARALPAAVVAASDGELASLLDVLRAD